jgi:glycosyltransferase involved in cell wall biosynthesis
MGIRKIAILTHNVEGGAFANLSTSLARGFNQIGIDSDVVVLNATEKGRLQYPDVRVVSLDAKRTILSVQQTMRYIREQKPDVIFPMPWYFNVIAIWARALTRSQTKIVIGEHNICSLEAAIEHKNNPRIRYILPILMRYTYPHGDGLIGVSQDTITDLLTNFKIPPVIPMQAIANPIDPERIQKLSVEPLDHPWFQDSEIPVVLTVARLAKQKQLDVLLRAFAQVVKTLPARLLILGEGPLRAELEHLCQDLGIETSVAMPGFDHNPYRYMSRCGAFVLASAWEGCPIALQESMACGAAVIVNDAPGGSKDVVEHGKSGMLVPNGDVDALAIGITKLLSDRPLQQHYQQQAKQRSQDFHYLKISQQYLEFYQSLHKLEENPS